MSLISYDELRIEPLTERHNLTNFSCDENDLNEYLKKDSIRDQEKLISKIFVCIYKENVVGFFAILADTIKVQNIQTEHKIDGCEYRTYPALKIGRLTVDKRYERKGIGKYLILNVLGASFKLIEIIGIRFMTVDSKHTSLGFYEKMGFTRTSTQRDYPTLYKDIYPYYSKLFEKDKTLDEFTEQRDHAEQPV